MTNYAKIEVNAVIATNDDYNPASERYKDPEVPAAEIEMSKWRRELIDGAAAPGTEVDVQGWSGAAGLTYMIIKNTSTTTDGSFTADYDGTNAEIEVPAKGFVMVAVDDDTATNPFFIGAGVSFDVLFYVPA